MKVEIWVSDQITKMQLKILGVKRQDLRTYRCVANNILGETEGKVTLTGGYITATQYLIVTTSNLPESKHQERRRPRVTERTALTTDLPSAPTWSHQPRTLSGNGEPGQAKVGESNICRLGAAGQGDPGLQAESQWNYR